MFLSCETAVEFFFEFLAVEILTDKNEFYHPVSVFVIPVAEYGGVLAHEFTELVFGSCGIPVSCLGKLFLHSGLLEYV